MKKPKISLDKDKIQLFLLHHVEKILLVVFIGLMGLLIFQGYNSTRGRLAGDKTPVGLSGKSDSTMTYIDQPDRWIKEVSLLPERMVDFNVVARAEETRKHTDPLAYTLPNTLSKPDFPKLSPREDPLLFPPERIVARPVVGPLASYAKAGDLDPLVPVVKEAPKKAPPKKKKLAADLEGGMMPGDGAMPMPGPGGKTKKGKKGQPTGEEGSGLLGLGGRMPMPGYGGMPGEGGMLPGGLYPDAMKGFQVQSPEATIARDVPTITIMAVVPIQKQAEEYDKKLANSLDYDPKRDYPWYLQYQVQRADVTELDPAAEIDEKAWKAIASPAAILREAFGDERTPGLYAGMPPEVSDQNYLDEKLTLPAPPYLARNLWDLLSHPDVPLSSQGLPYGESAAGTAAGGTAPAPGSDELPSLQNLMGPGGSGMPGGGGMPGGPGGLGSADGYGGGRPFGRSPMGEGGMPGPGGMRPPMMGGSGIPGGYGMPRGGYDGEGGYGAMGGGMTYTPPKYKLIRYTDLHVERGHKYRYRFRVLLNDPNHPIVTMLPPSAASLHGEVQKRVKQLDAEDAKQQPKNGIPARTFWVTSSWSEPSPIAELPSGERVYVGKVSPKAPTPIKNVPVPLLEPSADVLTVNFDRTRIADIPAEQEKVIRGSVLNYTQDKTKVIHPVTKEIIDLEKYPVVTDAVVADLAGGEKINLVSKTVTTPLTALGEILVLDAQGRLQVRNEGEDIDYFRQFTVPKEDPNTKSQPPGGESGLEGSTPRPTGRPLRGGNS